MTEDYIHMDDHKRMLNDAFTRGIIIGELRRLCTVHAAEPQTLEVLQAVRTILGDAV